MIYEYFRWRVKDRAPGFRPILLGYVRLGLDEKTLDEKKLDEN